MRGKRAVAVAFDGGGTQIVINNRAIVRGPDE